MINTRQLQFDKGIMRLSAYDPVSNQYETRTLTLPELPLLESLEHLFNTTTTTAPASSTVIESNNTGSKLLRLTKSCNNKKSAKKNSIRHDVVLTPRRCQSNPNLSKQQQKSFRGELPFTWCYSSLLTLELQPLLRLSMGVVLCGPNAPCPVRFMLLQASFKRPTKRSVRRMSTTRNGLQKPGWMKFDCHPIAAYRHWILCLCLLGLQLAP